MSVEATLAGRVALVTGVSRPIGIGATVASRLHAMGATVYATGWPAHDEEMPWGRAEIDLPFRVARHDLEDPAGPAALVQDVLAAHGRLDITVAVHARSSAQQLPDVTAEELQRSWNANVQSVVLLAQQFAKHHEPVPAPETPTGRMLWFTSGQHLGPMDDTLTYAITKGALQQMTVSLGRALAPARIAANCINPGPVDTGWADAETHDLVAASFPDKRWGTPDDVANLVAFLVSDDGAWIRGQVLNSEGGFDRQG